MIRLLLVDDDDALLESLSIIFRSEDDLDVVGTAPNGLEAVFLAGRLKPDVMVIDLAMPVLDGIETVRRLIGQQEATGVSGPGIVVLTTLSTDKAAFEALQAGAIGFCTKGDSPEFLVRAVRTVAAGGAIVTPDILGVLFRRLIPSGSTTLSAVLSPREVEILSVVAEGANNQEIARRFLISDATVRTHVQSLRRKLNARSRAELVVKAYQLGEGGQTLAPSL
jgi:DNA-binding NarL/FixJ family response regulator